jgi:hypothetical protein
MTEQRTLLWRAWTGDGLAHARMRFGDNGISIDGVTVAVRDGRPLRLRYEIACDSRGFARALSAEAIGITQERFAGQADEEGTWKRVDGGLLDAPLYAAYDVEIEGTPAAVTCAIRRLALEEGQSAELHVVALSLPDLRASRAQRRLTCLSLRPDGSRYRYDGPEMRPTEVTVDADGTVVEAEGTFRRIWPAPARETLPPL